MKVVVPFKNPDALHQASFNNNLSDEEREAFYRAAEKFIKWGEYVNIEIDIEKGAARVIEC